MSSFFNLQRGCRQGDPLSPYLFIIGVELLAIKLESDPNIHGVMVQEKEILLSQYADDTFLMLDGKEKSLSESLNVFELFYKASGLKMNASKTKAIWVGSKKNSNHVLCSDKNFQWSVLNFKVLGLEFSLNLNDLLHINFRRKYLVY